MTAYRKHNASRALTRGRKRRVRGGSLFSWIKNKAVPWIGKTALPFLKKTKLISRGASLAGKMGFNNPLLGKVGDFAGKMGYGKPRIGQKKITYGMGTTPAGGALRPAGMGRRKEKACVKYCRRKPRK
jgi:hypothetical protein